MKDKFVKVFDFENFWKSKLNISKTQDELFIFYNQKVLPNPALSQFDSH